MTIQIPPDGTHGARMPSGRMAGFSTGMMATMYRATGGRFPGWDALLLTTVGARSGHKRTAFLRWFADGDGRWLVVGSAGGAAHQPAWLHNLARNPDQLTVELGRDRFPVRPELLAGDEHAEAWRRIVAAAPNFGEYEHKTDRQIPVVRLTRFDPAG